MILDRHRVLRDGLVQGRRLHRHRGGHRARGRLHPRAPRQGDGQAPRQAAGQRRPHALRHDPAPRVRRHPVRGHRHRPVADPCGRHARPGDARLGGHHRRRHRHRRPGAHRQPRQRHHDRLLPAGPPERLHQRRRRVRHRRADLAHLHVHPQRRRPARRHPQRGLRDEGGPQLLDGLAGQHGDRRPRAAARRRRRARRPGDARGRRIARAGAGAASRTASRSPTSAAAGCACGCTPGPPTRCGVASSPATCGPHCCAA